MRAFLTEIQGEKKIIFPNLFLSSFKRNNNNWSGFCLISWIKLQIMPFRAINLRKPAKNIFDKKKKKWKEANFVVGEPNILIELPEKYTDHKQCD